MAEVQAATASGHTSRLAAIKQQQKQISRAVQDQQKALTAAERTFDALKSQKALVDKELQALVKQVPELSSMLAR